MALSSAAKAVDIAGERWRVWVSLKNNTQIACQRQRVFDFLDPLAKADCWFLYQLCTSVVQFWVDGIQEGITRNIFRKIRVGGRGAQGGELLLTTGRFGFLPKIQGVLLLKILIIPEVRSRKIRVLSAHDTGPRFSIGIADKMDSKSLSLRFFPALLKSTKMSSTCVEHMHQESFSARKYTQLSACRKK